MSRFLESLKLKYDDMLVGIDPLVDNWLFMKSPVPILCILAVYLYFVLKKGPQMMEKRKPFEIQGLLIGYNAYQVIFSIWLCSQVFHAENGIQYFFSGGCKNASTDRTFAVSVWRGAWWYFFSKIVELLDTVFFVLRKKQSQVSFLHVYHHTITCFFSWGYLKYLPGEQGVVIGFLNSAVHVIMYFYYMVAAMGPKYQKYIWWKKYMTWIQLTQFCLMLSYLVFIIMMDCNLHRSLTFFFVGNCVIFLYLFSDFYRKSYIKNKKINADNNNINYNSNNSKIIQQQTNVSNEINCNNMIENINGVKCRMNKDQCSPQCSMATTSKNFKLE